MHSYLLCTNEFSLSPLVNVERPSHEFDPLDQFRRLLRRRRAARKKAPLVVLGHRWCLFVKVNVPRTLDKLLGRLGELLPPSYRSSSNHLFRFRARNHRGGEDDLLGRCRAARSRTHGAALTQTRTCRTPCCHHCCSCLYFVLFLYEYD